MDSQISIKRGQIKLLKELVALFLFLTIGVFFAAPCLCPAGAVRGQYTLGFLLLCFLKDSRSVFRRKFSYKDYFIYLFIVIVFSLWADSKI